MLNEQTIVKWDKNAETRILDFFKYRFSSSALIYLLARSTAFWIR